MHSINLRNFNVLIMKRLTIIIASILLGLCAGAQNMYDAINFSKNNYYGTARSMALGNAVTAVGGDLGTVSINPAGSAVAGYGQFTITPGVSVSASSSTFGDVIPTATVTRRSKTNMPNLGFMFNFDTNKDYGVKSFTIGLVMNATNNFLNRYDLTRPFSATSRFAENAAAANGIAGNLLSSYDSYYNTDINWDLLTAYQANLFSDYGQGNLYAANSEAIIDGNHFVPDVLNQRVRIDRYGMKKDLVVNFAANISDRVFVGINIGLPNADYEYSETYRETPDNPDMFTLAFVRNGQEVKTCYESGTSSYVYGSDYDGVYAHLGVIALPFKWLRLGASFRTPTVYSINERWQYSASSTYSNPSFNGNASSPIGEYQYKLVSPYSFSLGAAMTLGARLLLSMDYELTDYSSMYFDSEGDSYGFDQPFVRQNELISMFSGASHAYRFGIEWRVMPTLSLRYGWSSMSNPERYYEDEFGNEVNYNSYQDRYNDYSSGAIKLKKSHYVGKKQSSNAFGIGYSSNGSFFADFAVRVNRYATESYQPYYDYDNYDKNGNQLNVLSPIVNTNQRLVDYVLTLGWRF